MGDSEGRIGERDVRWFGSPAHVLPSNLATSGDDSSSVTALTLFSYQSSTLPTAPRVSPSPTAHAPSARRDVPDASCPFCAEQPPDPAPAAMSTTSFHTASSSSAPYASGSVSGAAAALDPFSVAVDLFVPDHLGTNLRKVLIYRVSDLSHIKASDIGFSLQHTRRGARAS